MIRDQPAPSLWVHIRHGAVHLLKIEIQVSDEEKTAKGYFATSFKRSGVAFQVIETWFISVHPKQVSKNSGAVSQSRLPHHQGPRRFRTWDFPLQRWESYNFCGFLGTSQAAPGRGLEVALFPWVSITLNILGQAGLSISLHPPLWKWTYGRS